MNPLLSKNQHIISVQMLLILLKKIIQYGNYATMNDDSYEIVKDDYKKIVQLQLVVAEEVNKMHLEEIDLNHFLYSTYHLNYPRNLAHEFLRMYYMLEKIGKDKSNFDLDVQAEYRDYYSLFTEKYGFTPTQYSSFLFWETSVYYSGINGLKYSPIWRSVEKIYGKSAHKDLIAKVITTLSQPVEGYVDWVRDSETKEWDFSKFFEFPFIMDAEKNYISVSDITLRNAFFEKIFWLIKDSCPAENGREMAFFGRLFEKYIQELTYNIAKEGYEYIAEFVYGKSAKKSSDAYLRKEENLLVVEVKGFSVLLDCMIKNEKIENNNQKMFINPILQADKCLNAVIEERSEFTGVENVYVVSVTMDNINAVPGYYREVYKSIETKKRCEKIKYYFNFNVEEYEMLMFLAEQRQDIFSLLKEYFENKKLKPFSNFLHEKYQNITMTSFMENLYKEASELMKDILFAE